MRISTKQIYTQGIEAFQNQQVKLAKLQEQISSGVKLTKPSDDPAAASRVLELEQEVSVNLQYQANINLAEQRLGQQDAVMETYARLLNRVRELAIQGNNGPLDPVSRNAIAVELDERLGELYSLANTTDANGDYLFGGYQNGNPPFTPATTGSIDHVSFNGDGGSRSIQISKVRQMEIDVPGKEIFMQIPSSVALREIPALANAGSGVIAPASVVDSSVYVPGDYEIRFTAPGVYDVFDVSLGANIVTGEHYDEIPAQMVDMETFAVLRAAHRFGIPVIGLRGISDGRDPVSKYEDWTRYLDDIDHKLAVIVDRMENLLGRNDRAYWTGG